jgi:hypothetical protein
LGPFSFQIKKKNQLQSQTLFSLFFCPWCERCERKLLESRAKERKFMLARISAPKTVEIGVKLFLMMRRAHVRGFFYIEIDEKNRSNLNKIFLFWVDFRFWDGFLLF